MRQLNEDEIRRLRAQGCEAQDWSRVRVADDGFDVGRVRHARFLGAVTLGPNGGAVPFAGQTLPAGIAHATLGDCDIGADVLISNIGGLLSRLRVGDGAAIVNTGEVTAAGDSAFGVGTRVVVINEAGGRPVTLFPGLSAQIAHLQALHRHNGAFIARLESLIAAEVAAARADKAPVGAGARIAHCGVLRDVAIGPAAIVEGAARLVNGTILSAPEAPAFVGAGVCAEDFLIAEGARVESGACLSACFVGQGARVGRQFSADNSLIFANCELFNGEGCAIFAGPCTVSHHKSTLLLAALYSFYNAGSGTNASNHMYKLGPCHQGVYERGCKTGSFAYVLLDSHIGAFSVIIGKHAVNLHTPDLPFSYIFDDGGTPALVPGINLTSAGLARDAQKWPDRDRRPPPLCRDLVIFDVFSPYTVEKMIHGRDRLNEACAGGAEEVRIGGARVTRSRMKRGVALYETAIARYLCGKIMDRVAAGLEAGGSWGQIQASLSAPSIEGARDWADLSGLIARRDRVAALEADVASGAIASAAEMSRRLRSLWDAYAGDEWAYVCAVAPAVLGVAPSKLTPDEAIEIIDRWSGALDEIERAIEADARKEFGSAARIGYGLDGDEAAARGDFEAVRGVPETQEIIERRRRQLQQSLERAGALKTALRQRSLH